MKKIKMVPMLLMVVSFAFNANLVGSAREERIRDLNSQLGAAVRELQEMEALKGSSAQFSPSHSVVVALAKYTGTPISDHYQRDEILRDVIQGTKSLVIECKERFTAEREAELASYLAAQSTQATVSTPQSRTLSVKKEKPKNEKPKTNAEKRAEKRAAQKKEVL